MLAAAFFFASMALGIKFASHSFTTAELVFYRGLVSVALLSVVVRARGASLRTAVPRMHLTRSAIGVLSLSAWFYTIAKLPLATAMTLNYMSGIWIAGFVVAAALRRGQTVNQGPLALAVVLGFGGVVLTLHPTLERTQTLATVVGLLSSLGAALAYMQVSELGRVGEPEERTVFYFSVGTTAVGACGMLLTQWTPWSAVRIGDAIWIVPIGIFASLGQWCMTRAYRDGATLVIASMQYAGIVFASIFSLTLFGDALSARSWAGIGVIVFSGLLATALRSRQEIPPTAATAVSARRTPSP